MLKFQFYKLTILMFYFIFLYILNKIIKNIKNIINNNKEAKKF